MNNYRPYAIPISAKGIVFDKDRVWLRKNERQEWELPGGKVDQGEQPETTVARELKEELGFEVVVKRLTDAFVYTINKSIDETQGVLVISYLCELVQKSGPFELDGEGGRAEFKSFTLDQVADLNMSEFYKKAIKIAASV